jgi:hypothetical protein
MTGTLICDEDGLYDPRQFNDRLLLGMKGQMSEAFKRMISALRSLLGFLHVDGISEQCLATAVPSVSGWSQAA